MNAQQKVYETILNSPEGISNEKLTEKCCDIDQSELKEALNNLLAQHLVVVQSLAGSNELVFVAVEEKEAQLLGQMDDNERMIYTHIKASDNRGIWMKELLNRTNLHRAVALKVLKSLEQLNIIKSVKSVKNPSRKIFMLYDLIPSVDLTGGIWFTDNELDTEMINVVSKVALKYISEACKISSSNPNARKTIQPTSFRYPTATNVMEFVNGKGILMQELDISDVKELLKMLVDARQLECIDGDSYRPDPRALSNNGDTHNFMTTTSSSPDIIYKTNYWTEIPCGKCPVFDQCSSIGRITPATCQYFSQWLSF